MYRQRTCTVTAGLVFALFNIGGSVAGDGSVAPIKAASRTSFQDWTGPYVGGHVAFTRGHVSNTLIAPGATASGESFGPTFGGLQFGYNFMPNSRVVLGVEADMTFTNHLVPNQVIATRTSAQTTVTETLDYIGTLRGRAGYTFGRWLVYGTGGLAWSQARIIEAPGVALDEDKVLRTRIGWAAGAGTELAVAPLWSARLEYLYYQLGSIEASLPSGTRYQSTFDMHALRFGLNRQLGGPDIYGAKTTEAARIASGDWNLHSQFTFIGQGYRAFRSPYEGENSLSGANQARNTTTLTAFLGLRPWSGGEIYLNPEIMQGFGLSDVHGVAAFPNGEAQKSNFPTPRFNMARMYLRQTFGLGGETESIPDGPNQLADKQDISRLSVTIGKFGVRDFFDVNAYSGEPRTGFMNWNIYGGGSYDWTMDRLSWTWGGMAELNQKHWTFRTGYFLMPVVANTDNFDMNIPTRGEYVAELELRYALFKQPGKLRLFGWVHRGTMGTYADALALPLSSANYPDIALTRQVRMNYGLVANLEQDVGADLGVFSRVTWSPVRTELIGWTDAHQTVSLGGVMKGTSWGRPDDKIGVAGVIEALSPEARTYFAAGGLGILIGDGRLNYRREKALEAYYSYAVNAWSSVTFDYQFITDPGYNADRGPISVYSVRFHWER